MNNIKDPCKNTLRPLENIRFYRDVVALFTLSRKLKTHSSCASHHHQRAHKTDLILNHFSEQLIKLPLAIAEAEVTRDELKKIAIRLEIKSHIPELLAYWTQLKRQLAAPSEWTQAGDQMMKRLPKHYGDWTHSLSCKN